MGLAARGHRVAAARELAWGADLGDRSLRALLLDLELAVEENRRLGVRRGAVGGGDDLHLAVGGVDLAAEAQVDRTGEALALAALALEVDLAAHGLGVEGLAGHGRVDVRGSDVAAAGRGEGAQVVEDDRRVEGGVRLV